MPKFSEVDIARQLSRNGLNFTYKTQQILHLKFLSAQILVTWSIDLVEIYIKHQVLRGNAKVGWSEYQLQQMKVLQTRHGIDRHHLI